MSFDRECLGEKTEITLSVVNDNNIGEKSKTFIIDRMLGHGRSSYAYLAHYVEGDREYKCILKELYPEKSGLVRKGSSLHFGDASTDELFSNIEKYRIARQKAEDSCAIQMRFYNTEENNWLNPTTSAPIGMYEDLTVCEQDLHCDGKPVGILYTVFTCVIGECYADYQNESLNDALTVAIRLSFVVNEYHKQGYLCFDIKDKNLFIVGQTEYLNIMLFDFDSFNEIERMLEFTQDDNVDDLQLSFTSCEKGLLQPEELVSLSNHISALKIGQSGPVKSDKTLVEYVTNLAKDEGNIGRKTDMFLIASLLFKRIFGRPATQKEIKTKPSQWVIPDSHLITSEPFSTALKQFFSKALAKRTYERFENMEQFINALEELKLLAVCEDQKAIDMYAEKGIGVCYYGTTKEAISAYSGEQWNRLSSEHGKFAKLRSLNTRFNSRIHTRLIGGNNVDLNDVFGNNEAVFLQGDGGMGKSTSIYDYWTARVHSINSDKVCIYVDLSLYKVTDAARGASSDHVSELLLYIVRNIFHNNSITPDSDILKEKEQTDTKLSIYKQMMFIQEHCFQKKIKSPEYILFLDGYNEILDRSDRSFFVSELKYILQNWQNVKVVVTSRTLPEEHRDDMQSLIDFDGNNNEGLLIGYAFSGVQDDEIKEVLIRSGKSTDPEKIVHDKRLWEILHIPMFLGMYVSLYDEGTEEIHTKGEIIHAFVKQDENETAERISHGYGQNKDYRHFRGFIISYCLPFVANIMDREESNFYHFSTESGYSWASCLQNGYLLYNGQIWDNYTKFSSYASVKDFAADFDKDKVEHLLLNETGYCTLLPNHQVGFVHQYFRDYFAALFIHNILDIAQSMGNDGHWDRTRQRHFVNSSYDISDYVQGTNDSYGLKDYIWSQGVYEMLGDIEHDYRNVPPEAINK